MQVSLDVAIFVSLLIGGMAWLFRLEAKSNRSYELARENEGRIETLRVEFNTALKLNQNRVNELDDKVVTSIEEMKDSMFALTIEVTKMMAKIDHMNKNSLDLKADELRELLRKQ